MANTTTVNLKNWYNGLRNLGYELWFVADTFKKADSFLNASDEDQIVDGFVTVSFESFTRHRLDFEVWVQPR